ncbi:conserved exported hypothetical protein [Luteimonas sp. 9C]|uniref:DUF1176 domain-containing protein n=1 Tax=Luteimonas sp. 9C TaxID=2653148 RepID=UPI0012F45AB5|nr:DUF1176 domain-containing protein [Luteimonas sp. 9C]VXC09109.1 conserved exported hypothetical protein [Luteimonas sp. 9C]
MSNAARKSVLLVALLVSLGACTQRDAETPASSAAPAAPPETDAASSADASARPAAPAGTPAAPVYRTFRDVTVACDNVRSCAAIGVTDAAPGLVLSLTRDAGADGAQVLLLSAPWADVDASTLQLDGIVAPAIAALPWQRDAGENAALRIEDPAAIARFLDLVRDGTRLGDDQDRSVSLSGLNAALLYIDEHQQRLETPGAWVRRGDRDPAAIPAAPALPVLVRPASAPPPLSDADAARLTRSVRASQTSALRAQECNAAGGDFDVSREDAAYPLDVDHALVFISCYSGAYQGSSLVFRAARDGSDVTRLTLPAPEFSDDSVHPSEDFDLLVSPGLDAVTGTLAQFAKGRGIGDCGFEATWQFDGRAFQLSHYAEMQTCGGLSADAWPVLWRVAEPAAAP